MIVCSQDKDKGMKFKISTMRPDRAPDYYCVTFVDRHKTKHHLGKFDVKSDAEELKEMLSFIFNLGIEEGKNNEE